MIHPLSSKASLLLKTERRPLELSVFPFFYWAACRCSMFFGTLNSIDNFLNDVPKEKQGNNEKREK